MYSRKLFSGPAPDLGTQLVFLFAFIRGLSRRSLRRRIHSRLIFVSFVSLW